MARSDISSFTARAIRSGIENSLSGKTLSVTAQPLRPPLRLDLNFRSVFCFDNHSPLCFIALAFWHFSKTSDSTRQIIHSTG